MDSQKLQQNGPMLTCDLIAGDVAARNLRALVDTGANTTLIDLAVAEKLNILTDLETKVGSGVERQALTGIGLSKFSLSIGNTSINYGTGRCYAVTFHSDSEYQLLIGRDVLRCGRLEYDGVRGRCSLTFSQPIVEETLVERDENGQIKRTVKKATQLYS